MDIVVKILVTLLTSVLAGLAGIGIYYFGLLHVKIAGKLYSLAVKRKPWRPKKSEQKVLDMVLETLSIFMLGLLMLMFYVHAVLGFIYGLFSGLQFVSRLLNFLEVI